MKIYTLKVEFDLPETDEELTKIFLRFSRGEFKYSLARSIAPPHHVVFEFERLSDTGVENVKAQFRTFNISGGRFTTVETYG
jgi:hypothetical protein